MKGKHSISNKNTNNKFNFPIANRKGKDKKETKDKRWKEKERGDQKDQKILHREEKKDRKIYIAAVTMRRLLH